MIICIVQHYCYNSSERMHLNVVPKGQKPLPGMPTGYSYETHVFQYKTINLRVRNKPNIWTTGNCNRGFAVVVQQNNYFAHKKHRCYSIF